MSSRALLLGALLALAACAAARTPALPLPDPLIPARATLPEKSNIHSIITFDENIPKEIDQQQDDFEVKSPKKEESHAQLDDKVLKNQYDGSNNKADAEAEPIKYNGAQLWKVSIEDKENIILITNLTRQKGITTWGGSHSTVDVLVQADQIPYTANQMREYKVPFNVIIEDLQRNIDEENPAISQEELELQYRKGHYMTWTSYHRLSDIHGFLDYLAKTYPAYCSIKTIGQSHHGRDLKVLRISNGNPTNKAVWIDGGIHAREWISPATVTYIINQFAENFEGESESVQNMDWYFLPVINPDGYEYSHTIDRLWRKNRKAGICTGIDLNRNFGYRWGGKGTSQYPCSEIYSGKEAFSEPESRAVSDFIMHSTANFKAYLTYHSYGQYLLYPWGYDNEVPPDHRDLEDLGNRMAEEIRKLRGTSYTVGPSSAVLYPAAGGSDDWAKGAAGIKYAYTVELSDKGDYGFVLPASHIISVAKESLAGLRVLADTVYQSDV